MIHVRGLKLFLAHITKSHDGLNRDTMYTHTQPLYLFARSILPSPHFMCDRHNSAVDAILHATSHSAIGICASRLQDVHGANLLGFIGLRVDWAKYTGT
jgi:hypothetical protein